VKLGGVHRFTQEQKVKGAAAAAAIRVEEARARARVLRPIVLPLQRAGLSLRAIGARLEERKFLTSTGKKKWGASQVRSLLRLMENGGAPE
jgi:hypothetical protein